MLIVVMGRAGGLALPVTAAEGKDAMQRLIQLADMFASGRNR